MGSVSLKNIFKSYTAGQNVVHGINLEIHDGEFMVLVGSSGCGKSTTLRMIAGLEEISSGELKIDNVLVNKVEPKDRGIAMVFQNYALYPHMTVYDNIAFGLKIANLSKEQIDKRVEEVAEMLEIKPLLDRKPKNMSGGQRQRVALGRAIARQAKVYLFDEPLSNLDAKLRVSMRVRLAQLHDDLKNKGLDHTMIYVTHDQVEAMTLGDRICVMENGYIRQVDTPINLYEKPINKFVAEFIGTPSMNFIHATIEANGSNFYAKIENMKLSVASEKTKNLASYSGKQVGLGIRAEHITLATNDGDNTIKVKINVVEHMGNEALIYFNLKDTLFVMRTTDLTNLPKTGDECFVKFDSQKIYLFDPSSELNINFIDENEIGKGKKVALDDKELLNVMTSVIGGLDNLAEVDSCISRLRLVLHDDSKLDKTKLESMGIKYLMQGDNKCHIVLGVQSETVAKEFKKILR